MRGFDSNRNIQSRLLFFVFFFSGTCVEVFLLKKLSFLFASRRKGCGREGKELRWSVHLVPFSRKLYVY